MRTSITARRQGAREDASLAVEAMRDTTRQQVEAMHESSARQVAVANDEVAVMRETTAAARDEVDASHRPLLI
jgi:hydrogenase maturation factor